MDTVYVIGHKNPDTDSVVSAIAYASLRNALGGDHYIPARYGHLNTETAFLLERFGFPSPLYLRNVRTQVSDIDYDTPPVLGSTVPVSYAWQVLHDDNNRIWLRRQPELAEEEKHGSASTPAGRRPAAGT